MGALLRATLYLLPILLGAHVVEPSLFDLLGNPFGRPRLGLIVDPFLPRATEQPEQVAEAGKRPDFETKYAGEWKLVRENAGVSAMHLVIMKNNKAIMFDTTVLGPSQIALPQGNCRVDPNSPVKALDCWAHAVEFDIDTAEVRPLKVLTDTWCSSGGFDAEGTLVQTGGYNDGGRAVRYLKPCAGCDWEEFTYDLSAQKWYSTQQILPNGSFVVVGGRREFNYEYVPPAGKANTVQDVRDLPFLRETTDVIENNLYPFVHLNTDGNLFIFANDRAILLDPKADTVIREYPSLPGGSRNYPASGMSVLLPLDLRRTDVNPEVLICGGCPRDSFNLSAVKIFVPALTSCGRIAVNNPDAAWNMEEMPMPRTLGDMLLLPNAEVLIINGAAKGSAGWRQAKEPVLTPVLYRPGLADADGRFRVLAPSTIPRMYHSTSAVLPDGDILVAGSNTNDRYRFIGEEFPTELRVEKFRPPYLDPALNNHRPVIDVNVLPGEGMKYGRNFTIAFTTTEPVERDDLMVTMYAPPFTTHGISMNQRLLILKTEEFATKSVGSYAITVVAPPSAAYAPPGYYLVHVVHRGVPSKAVWVKISV
ncbi:aldehyde oxidase GLOX1-like [Elaeis guineensis]|uniref:Aldehyde oxidase GLOX1-like n=1 Tax=Elaeis guineensis var. tenera TaxID=51953 RepID=A0A6I9RD50_ELAGV|nr:aldehyde oxidase GLOX1-like [Elaeis guineensis]